MTHLIRFITATLLAATLLLSAGCSKKKNFTVQGRLDGLGAQLITATYYTGGGLKRISIVSADDKFALRGEAARPTLLRLALADGTTLGNLVVENGDKIKLEGSVDDPLAIEVSGNPDSEKIARWTSDNAALLRGRNAAAINRSLAEWVADNRSSKAATALMVTYFQTEGYEHLADSLMTLLSNDARAQDVVQNFTGVLSNQLGSAASAVIAPMTLYEASDSMVTVSPHVQSTMLLCFMPDNRTARDSVGRCLRRLSSAFGRRRFTAVEISAAPDSATWRQSIAGDSATWRRTWAPATVASSQIRRLAVPRLPYFIVADSLGMQIYRGASIGAAARAVEKRLGR